MITVLTGDATKPIGEGPRVIAHICNDLGAWGRGFVLSLSRQYPLAEDEYRSWFRRIEEPFFELGAVQFVSVDKPNRIHVANMIAQSGIYPSQGKPPIRYDALEKCLSVVGGFSIPLGASIHMPRIGSGLAGGDWGIIERIITRTIGDLPIFIYDLK